MPSLKTLSSRSLSLSLSLARSLPLSPMNEDEIDISSSSSSSSPPSPTLLSPNKTNFDPTTSGSEDETGEKCNQLVEVIKSAGELTLDDLPPVEKLDLTAKGDDLDQIGRVCNTLNRLVIVSSFKNKPPLNLDSVLFLRDCHPLGAIFETFGPVKQPYYAVRFNSKQEIDSRNISIDMPVYFLPQSPPPTTSYVFVKDLVKIRGSDASWIDDNEPPEDCVEFSDDEEERQFKKKLAESRSSRAKRS